MKTAKEDIRICIARIYYPVEVLGPGKRVGIWTLGCDRGCRGCISPELREYDERREVRPEDVALMLDRIPGKLDGFTVSGGEPFYQPEALANLVGHLAEINDDILIFTGYTYEELKASRNEAVQSVLRECSALIAGPYIEEQKEKNGLRGSSNQQYCFLKHKDRYKSIPYEERALQTIVYGNKVLTIGIP